MKLRLNEIASIRLGIFCKPSDYGDARYLQSVDYGTDGRLHEKNKMTPMVSLDNNTGNHILNQGDILFSAKGDNNYAVVFKSTNYPCLASTSFLVITVNNQNQILPEYVCWYMNNPDTMKVLKTSMQGTNIHSITKSAIKNVEIHIPSLGKQELVVGIDSCLQEGHIIQNKLLLLRRQLLLIQSCKL